METKTEKPLSIRIKELQNNIIQNVNTSGLPISIINYVVKDIANVINMQNEQTTQQEEQSYYSALQTQQNQNNETIDNKVDDSAN